MNKEGSEGSAFKGLIHFSIQIVLKGIWLSNILWQSW